MALTRIFLGANSTAGLNRSRGLNENLAREILELHTLGVRTGYTQDDVIGFANILTGWTLVPPADNPEHGGEFTFNPRLHEPGAQKVLGKSYEDETVEQGRAALRDLAIVVEHVYAAIGLEACLNHRLDIGGAGNVGGECGRLAAFGGDDFCGFFRGSSVPVNAKHLRALARKGHGGRLAVAPTGADRAGADHQRCLALEPFHR